MALRGQQRGRCDDRPVSDGIEGKICGSRRQRRGCPSRCVIDGWKHTRGRWQGAEGFGLETEDFGVGGLRTAPQLDPVSPHRLEDTFVQKNFVG